MAGQLTIDTLKASTGVLATQNGMTGIAKAWVKYNGYTPAILSSFNISSVTRNAAGDYTLNFTTAMANADYVLSFGCSPQNARYLVSWGGTGNNGSTPITNTTTAARVGVMDASTASVSQDATNVYVAVFGA